MASREASRLNFVRLPDALFMCCYYGVYPWRLLRPRSTKTAATVLVQVHQVRRLRVPFALPINLPSPTAKRTAAGVLRRQTRTRRLQEQPVLYLQTQFEQFWETVLIARVFTQDQIWPKHSRGQPINTQSSATDAWIITRPDAAVARIPKGTQQIQKHCSERPCFAGCPSATSSSSPRQA